jgi:hypothetical protein
MGGLWRLDTARIMRTSRRINCYEGLKLSSDAADAAYLAQ